MKRFEVEFLPQAAAEPLGLYDFIAQISGRGIAEGYLRRIEATCESLGRFPHRGTARDDIRPGFRTMGFERRATIAFQIQGGKVLIARIFYGGRDYETLLRSQP